MAAVEYSVRRLRAAVVSEVAAAGSGSVRQRHKNNGGGMLQRRAALLHDKGRHVEGGDENMCQRNVLT